jgi:protein-S-isoprenylcysteine O-methyltransferase
MHLSPSFAAVVAIVAFWLIEVGLRSGRSARSSERGVNDKGSTIAILAAYIIVMVTLVTPLGGPQITAEWRWLAVLATYGGVFLRIAAFRTLRGAYSRTLKVEEKQELITGGPYRILRNPGYSASIIIWSGAAAAGGSAVEFLVVLALLAFVYVYRIKSEEEMLSKYFGRDYAIYASKSWRLIPYIY